jgi:hypothetical protein
MIVRANVDAMPIANSKTHKTAAIANPQTTSGGNAITIEIRTAAAVMAAKMAFIPN